MVELINENFLEVVGNQLVIEYFNQQSKLNQSFGISGFSGTFKVVEEIPNSLLEHHPLVVYWKKQVGQFENAVVNATEAFFEKDNAVQQMTHNEQLALVALTKGEQMLGVPLNVGLTSHLKHLISYYVVTYERNNLKKGVFFKAYCRDNFLSILTFFHHF